MAQLQKDYLYFKAPDQSVLPGVLLFRYVCRQARFSCPASVLRPVNLSKEVPPSNFPHWTRNHPERAYFNLIGWSSCPSRSGNISWLGVRWNSRCEEKGDRKKKTSFESSGMIVRTLYIFIWGNIWQQKPTLKKMKSLKYRLKKHEVTITVSKVQRFF